MGPEGWCGVWFNWRFGDMFEKVLSIAWVVWCGDILSLRLERHYCVFLIKWWHGDRKQWRNFHSHSSARSPLTYSEMLSRACADTRTSTAHTLTSVRLEICLKNCDQVILTTNSDLGLAMVPCAMPQIQTQRTTKFPVTYHFLTTLDKNWKRKGYFLLSPFVLSLLCNQKCNFFFLYTFIQQGC